MTTRDEKRGGDSDIFARMMALVSLFVAGYAAFVTHQSRQDTRALAGLDLWPQLELRADFEENSPIISLRNSGPVSAVQVEIQLLSHFVSPDGRKILSGYSSEQRYRFDEVPPFRAATVPVSASWLESRARLHEPISHNVIEARILFRRPSDLKPAGKSAFYFINSDTGQWVPETNGSILGESGDLVRREVLRRSAELDAYYPFFDQLHDRNAEE